MIVDEAFANAILDGLAGPNLAPSLPGTMWVALYDDDPSAGGLECTGGSYGRLGPIDMGDVALWPAAAGREKTNAAQIVGPWLTGDFTEPATWAAFVDAGSGAPTLTAYAQQLPDLMVGGADTRVVLDPGDVRLFISDTAGSD